MLLWRPCLEKLFLDGCYEVQSGDDQSTINMVKRYADIGEAFPDELKGKAFPYFLDWLKYNVIFVEITAYSDENAYAIFESMNDRGLNLTSTEMLKGYILSRLGEPKHREKANRFWRQSVQSLQRHSKEEDQKFFQAWLRSQYADTIRQGKAGSLNEDFENIGTRFHNWFRDNLSKMGLKTESPGEFQTLVHEEMKYYLGAYLDILDARKEEKPGWENVFYHSKCWNADSLGFPLMLAPLKSTDSPDVARQKINEVGRFMEAFAVRRSINFRNFSASSIRYTMYSLVKELRGKNLDSLRALLQGKLNEMQETWDGLGEFRLHGMNRKFVKFLLSRITGFIEQESGAPTSFSTYFVNLGKKHYEVEHIWADKFEEHRNEFEQQHEFESYRNRIGDLVLLPQGTNQSFGAMSYAEKLEHYPKENLLVKSLHPKCYENNPNFVGMARTLGLKFKPHKSLTKADIDERQALIQSICEEIWGGFGQQSSLKHRHAGHPGLEPHDLEIAKAATN